MRDEILELVADSPPCEVYRVPRRSFMQPQLFRKGSSTTRSSRCMKATKFSAANPWARSGIIWQFPFRDLEEVLRKANRYSSLGIPKLAHKRVSMLSALGHGLWSFIKHYIFKLGFIDGRWIRDRLRQFRGNLLSLGQAL